MKIKLTNQEGKEILFYSYDIIERIRELNNALLETYPECASFCVAIDNVIAQYGEVKDIGFWNRNGKYKEDLEIVDATEMHYS